MRARRVTFAAAAILVVGWLSMGMFSGFQRQVIFPGPAGVTLDLLKHVAQQVGATELEIPTSDGETLYGWHRRAVETGPLRVVLYFHGNASSVLGQIDLQNLLVSEGWDFVAIHYRGYPGSTGLPSEVGTREDALAAWRYVTEVLGAAPNRVALHGRSLGGGVAVQLAASVQPAALVMESTFTSIADLANEQYKLIPVGRFLDHPFLSREFAPKVSCPVLVAHGTHDSIIDVKHGKALARLFRTDDYIELPHIDHNDVLLQGNAAARYLAFLERAVPLHP